MHDGQVELTLAQVASALRAQVPELGGLSIRRVKSAGTVVAPFRVGEGFLARIPLVPVADAAARARLQAEAEHALFLADKLPVQVPRPLHLGEPFAGYPGLWSVWTWVEGTSLDQTREVDQECLARELAALLVTFHTLPTGGQGWNGVGRGGRPLADTEWVRTSIQRCAHLLDPSAATAVWERALAAPPHTGPAVYIHGDPVSGNLIIRSGRLSGLVDIAEPSIGDPASDLAPAWTIFEEPARSVFRDAMGLDDATSARGRGWAFEMAIGGLHYYEHTNPVFKHQAAQTLKRLLGE
jgi:aminoglycoside phosphotransferase (APT) family kinase protein